MPQPAIDPRIPVIDPNSAIGRRLLAQQPQAPVAPGLARGAADLGGRDTADADIQQMLAQQHAAALGPPPPGILPPSPAAPTFQAAPPPAGRGANPNPSPADLASGNVPVAPVPTADPFRLHDPGLGRVAGADAVAPGEVIPFNPNDPRSRNPFLYQDGDTWRSSIQRGGMTADGFTPGFVTSGVGGAQTWAASPQDFLIAMQQNARAQGVNPGQLAEQFLGQLGATADRSGRAAVAAQGANVNLAGQRLQGDAQRDAARTAAEGQGRAAAFAAIPGFVAGLGAGTVPAPVADLMGGHITRAIQGGGAVPGFGGPMGPGAPALPGAPGVAPGGPAAPAGGNAPVNPFAAAAASGEFLGPLRGVFGTRNPQTGAVVRPEGFNLDASVQQLLDRFTTGTPDQRAAAVAAVERGELGNPDEVLQAIGRRGAIATLRAQGGLPPGQSGLGNIIGSGSLADRALSLVTDAVPTGNARAPFVVQGPGGVPLMTFDQDPNQSVGSSAVGRLFSGGVGQNRVTIPGFNPILFDRTAVNGLTNRAGATAVQDQRQGLSAQDFLRLTQRYQQATRPR